MLCMKVPTIGNRKFVIKQNAFPDGTLHLELPLESITNVYGPIGYSILWQYDNDAEIFALQCLVDTIRRSNPNAIINLDLPYIPHARMDRVKDQCEVFSLKTFADMINTMKFASVSSIEPHSDVSCALINRIEQRDLQIGYASIHCGNPDIVFFPDAGAMKRYSNTVKATQIAYGIKNRDWKTGRILELDIVGDIPNGAHVLIRDDICSKGGTFYYAAKKLKELGAGRIDLFVAHCENSILEGDFDGNNLLDTGLIDTVYTTDSILRVEDPRIKIVWRCDEL